MSSSALVDVAPALMFRDVSCQVHTRDIVQWPPFKKKTIQIIGDCSGLIHVCRCSLIGKDVLCKSH